MKRRLALLVGMGLVAGASHVALAAPKAAPKAVTYDKVLVGQVDVVTRYGDKMNVDLCFPSKDGTTIAPGKFPVIAELSPYVPTGESGCTPSTGCTGCTTLFADAVKRGYVVAQVNSPGSGDSQGGPWNFGQESYALRHYDAIEWLGHQKWSTGSVGTIGGSGVGVSQLQTAPYRPPSLKTMIPLYSSADPYIILKPGGMRHATELLLCTIPGAMVTGQNGTYTPPTSMAEVDRMIEIKRDQVTNLQGQPYCPPLEGSWAHPVRDGYWDDVTGNLQKVTIPVWSWGAQNDLFSLGTEDDWHQYGSKDKMLTFGFASHAGDYPGFDQSAEALRWFDHWLKGIDTGIRKDLKERRFRYNVFPDYIAKSATDFPIPATRYTKFFLDVGAPDPLATGALALKPPKADGASTYVYAQTDGKGYNPFGAGESNDQRLETGGRVSFLFDAVAEDTEVTGPIAMKLYASTTATDTDFVGKVLDIAPDGTWTHVPTNGYLKSTFGTYKNDYRTKRSTVAGEVVGYDMKFYPTSWMFKKGHRIGLSLSSADLGEIYPNPNPAVVTVHHSPKYPSAITLPLIPQ